MQYAAPWAGTVSDGFEEFYGRRWRDAVRWAAALTGRIDVAEELAQDVFVRMMPLFDEDAIARLLGCRAATVRTRAMRGLRRLRQALEEETTDGRS